MMAEDTPAQRASHLEPLSVLWRTLALPQPLLVCLGLLALAVALGTLIPQIPPQARNDPQAWLAVQSGPLPPSNSLIRALHLYDLYHSFGFRLVLAFSGLLLFVRAVDAAELAWRATRPAPWPPGAFAFWGANATQVTVPSPAGPESTTTRIRQFLAQQGLRWTEVAGLPHPNLVAAGRPLAAWVRPVGYVALLLALIGLAITGTWGWQAEDWVPAPGDVRAVGHGTGYQVRLDSFGTPSDAAPGLCDSRSAITWLAGDAPLRQDVVSSGQPSTLRGLALRQVGVVPQVTLHARDEDGRPVLLLPEGADQALSGQVEVHFLSSDDQPLVLFPSHDLFLTLAFVPAGRDGHPALDVTLARNGGAEAASLGRLYEGGTLAFDGFQVDVSLGLPAHPAGGLPPGQRPGRGRIGAGARGLGGELAAAGPPAVDRRGHRARGRDARPPARAARAGPGGLAAAGGGAPVGGPGRWRLSPGWSWGRPPP